MDEKSFLSQFGSSLSPDIPDIDLYESEPPTDEREERRPAFIMSSVFSAVSAVSVEPKFRSLWGDFSLPGDGGGEEMSGEVDPSDVDVPKLPELEVESSSVSP